MVSPAKNSSMAENANSSTHLNALSTADLVGTRPKGVMVLVDYFTPLCARTPFATGNVPTVIAHLLTFQALSALTGNLLSNGFHISRIMGFLPHWLWGIITDGQIRIPARIVLTRDSFALLERSVFREICRLVLAFVNMVMVLHISQSITKSMLAVDFFPHLTLKEEMMALLTSKVSSLLCLRLKATK